MPAMLRIYTGLVLWNLAVLTAAGAVGGLVWAGALEPRYHQLAGLFAAVLSCLVHSLLVIHFIGSMKWIQQTGPTAGLEDTKALRRAWFAGPMFPVVTFTMLTAVATAMVGGGAEAGGAALGAHVALAALNIPMNLWALALGRRAIVANHERIRHVGGLARERQEAGLVREQPVDVLMPESGRAGGKVFLFLAANVWLLWFYSRFVLRHHDESVWPYAIACAVLAVIGWRLLRSAAPEDGGDGASTGSEAPRGPIRR